MKKKILLVSLLTAGMLFSCSEKTPDGDKSVADNSATTSQSAPKASSSTAPKYKVTFDLNYQGAPNATSKTAGSNGKVTLPDDPVKEDSEFLGWNTKADGSGTKVTADDVYTADTTVYAQWHHHQYGTPAARAGSLTEAPLETPSSSATCGDATCGQTKISWSAFDIIESESAKFDKKTDYIRFNGPVHKDEDFTDEGSHLVYEIYSPKALAKASIYITATWHEQSATYWAKEEGDTAKGYEKKEDGTSYRPDYRWGIKINGVESALNEAEHKSPASGEVSEQRMPTEFALQQGINKIDLFTYGGYRAKMTAMKIIGK
jgi:uncharacterized repeat protein (TIGR02543 family)